MIGFNFAKYSTTANLSKGTLKHDEYEFLQYDVFMADVMKIMSSKAFRRMQNKTQVVTLIEKKNDHYRNRLTHSLEVANIARLIAQRMNLCQPLAEAISLAHDIGHPPLGHTGEDILNSILKEYDTYFCHNEHALRIVMGVYNKNPLNLSCETIEGILKHNFPVHRKDSSTIKDVVKKIECDINELPTLEAQISGISDDIAYLTHDLEDAIRYGVGIEEFFSLQIVKRAMGVRETMDVNVLTCVLRDILINDLISNTYHNIVKNKIDKRVVACLSPDLKKEARELKEFMLKVFYKRNNVELFEYFGEKIKKIFKTLIHDTSKITSPNLRYSAEHAINKTQKAVIVADYIAGMTDNFLSLHEV